MEEKNKKAEEFKLQGNGAFAAQNYQQAKEFYTQAIGKQSSGLTNDRTMS